MCNKYMDMFLASIINSQTKATVRFYYTSTRMANTGKTGNRMVLE